MIYGMLRDNVSDVSLGIKLENSSNILDTNFGNVGYVVVVSFNKKAKYVGWPFLNSILQLYIRQ